MKEVLGILCAAISVLAAVVAVDAMNKCADAEEKKTKKNENNNNKDFDCSCCDDYCECFDEVDVEDLDDIDLTSENEDIKTDEQTSQIVSDEPVENDNNNSQE